MNTSTASTRTNSGQRTSVWAVNAAMSPARTQVVIVAALLGIVSAGILRTPIGGLLSVFLALSNVSDCLHRRIPNRYTYSALLFGLLLNATGSLSQQIFSGLQIDRCGLVGATDSLFGAAVCFSVMFVIYCLSRGKSGAGDVKLAAAIGAFLGPQCGISVLAWCHVLAACWAVGTLVVRMGPISFVGCVARQIGFVLLPNHILPPNRTIGRYCRFSVPMAVFFTLGVCITGLGGVFTW
jgi:Flp pilus assembly protein protease CpaA